MVQLIDSLNAGGAERMAISFANSLSYKTDFSGLVTTRAEGALKDEINHNVKYLHLHRKKTFDVLAVFRCKIFLKKHQIAIIHAHGSAYFFAVLVKLVFFRIKIIYHEHNGNRVGVGVFRNFVLRIASLFFYKTIAVTPELQNWCSRNLFCKQSIYLPNFATINKNENRTTVLKNPNSKKIICLANLRYPKNHQLLIRVFSKIAAPNWSLHLIGKDYFDDYSKDIKNHITQTNSENAIFVYDSRSDISFILQQGQIGVLTSSYEGFPVSVVEYGMANLAVIAPNVGTISTIIQDHHSGFIFNSEQDFEEKLQKLMHSDELQIQFSLNLKNHIATHFSEQKVIQNLLDIYQ